jgi:hypothetical protein
MLLRLCKYGAGSVAQVVECLLNKCEALSSNPKKEKKDYVNIIYRAT